MENYLRTTFDTALRFISEYIDPEDEIEIFKDDSEQIIASANAIFIPSKKIVATSMTVLEKSEDGEFYPDWCGTAVFSFNDAIDLQIYMIEQDPIEVTLSNIGLLPEADATAIIVSLNEMSFAKDQQNAFEKEVCA